MSRVYSWGYERGYVKANPCAGVSKFKAKNRERYVTDKEYQAVLSVAPLPVFIAMEIAYLCAARVSDVLSLKWEQIGNDGIFIQQGKTGKTDKSMESTITGGDRKSKTVTNIRLCNQ